MKAGILTFHNAHNYGAALQVLATQTWLTRKGYDCEVINYRIGRIDRSYAATSAKRKQRFEDFMKKHLHLSPLYKSLNALQAANLPYDVLVAGSDQIWNAGLLGGLNSGFFCNFGRKEARRIIYAASLGSDELSPANSFLLPRYLQYPDFISVRENSMLPLIQPLTKKPVCTVLDPTFLLDLSDYQELVIPQNIPTPYIYLHYVHHTGENPNLDFAAKLLSEATGLPVMKNRAGQRFANELPSCQDNGPGEFLGTLSQAAYVVTDSFHATVFSILFAKNFLTVAPVKRPERLIELLQLLALDCRLYDDDFSPERFLTLPSFEKELPARLAPLREDSINFLNHALTAPIERKQISFPSTGNPYLCYGCGACTQQAPELAGKMQMDEDGFFYPSGTGKCLPEADSPCIFATSGADPATFKESTANESFTDKPEVYLAYHKDLYSRMISYEGGLLTEFFRKIHSQNGFVIGKVYNPETGTCQYRLSDCEETSAQFLASRPQDADTSELYRLISELPKDRPALIIDTPCHIAALYRTVPEAMQHILTLEQACNGIMSDAPLKAYFDILSHTEESPVTDYNLAAKHYGKSGIRAEFTHADGSLTTRYVSLCPLIQAYQKSDLQRPSCYACTFRDNVIGLADLSLAVARLSFAPDFAPEDKIISVISANSKAGQDFYHSCSEALEQRPLDDSDLSRCFPNSRLKPLASRPTFYQKLHGEQPAQSFKPYREKKKKK